MPTVLLSFPDDLSLAGAVAKRLGARLGRFEWRHFPDGESLIAIDEDIVGADVVFFASLNAPDRKALPLWFAAQTARDLGARRVGLVAPYLAYLRQDARFNMGEAISANAFAQFLDETIDWLLTADPHLHRIARLEAIFRIPAVCVKTAPWLAAWIRREAENPVLIGPDAESAQWVADVAGHANAPYEVLSKIRRGDREIQVSLPDPERLRDHTPVLLDDIASTGHTLIAALKHLRQLKLPSAICVVIHPLFAADALQALEHAGARRIVSTDSIAHPSNAISLAEPLADAVAEYLAGAKK